MAHAVPREGGPGRIVSVRNRIVALILMVGTTLWVVPPFAVIDDGSGGARHAAMGRAPFWRPPSTQVAAAFLTREVGPPPPGAQSRLRVLRNDVRLAMETALVVLVGGVFWWLAPSPRPRSTSHELDGAGPG